MGHILIIDDDPDSLDFLSTCLAHAGHAVRTARGPAAALTDAHREPPDLVISDIHMPGLNGFALVEKLRGIAGLEDTPVILVSSHEDGAAYRRAFGVGAVDYLVKPVGVTELTASVARSLEAAAARRQRLAAAPAGPSVPGYRLLSLLGEGGMSMVYLADDLVSGERCAVKLMSMEGDAAGDLVARFHDERQMLERVNHRHVARMLGHGVLDRKLFMSMEYFPRGDLRAAMAEGIAIATAFRYVREIAEGLAAVHALGIVHRDLKPANVMRREDDSIALVDFGIAKQLAATQSLTRAGEVLGTPHYMSPEQIRGGDVDARSDLYSLGVLFYELLTHERPHEGERLETILMKHLHAEVPRLPDRLSILQPLLDPLLAREPADRYADAGAFLRSLDLVGMLDFADQGGVEERTFSGVKRL